MTQKWITRAIFSPERLGNCVVRPYEGKKCYFHAFILKAFK